MYGRDSRRTGLEDMKEHQQLFRLIDARAESRCVQ